MRKRKGFCSKIGRAAALGTPPGPSLRSRALPLGSGSARSLGPASSVRSRSGSPPAFQRLRARPSAVCALSCGELAAPCHRRQRRRRSRAHASAGHQTARGKGKASRPRAPLDGPRRPGCVAPRHGAGSNAPLGQAPPPTAGSACGRAAATPAVGLGARAPSPPVPPVTGARAPAGLRQLPSAAIACNRTYRQLLVCCPPLSIWPPPAPSSLAPVLACQGLRRALGRGRRLRRRPLTACARPLPSVAGGVSHA